jgi:thioredoxin reductase (NADPH)
LRDTVDVRLVIVGGGPAGYTAALYGARLGLEPVCVEGLEAGGQVSRASLVENYPGAPDGTSGADLAERIREQAVSFGARLVMDDVTEVVLGKRPFTVRTSGADYRAESVIVATGSTPRALGLPLEAKLLGHGIAYCAVCDGAFFAGHHIAVVGGGNTALTEALAMHRVAATVTLVHRRREFRADAALETAVRAIGIRIVAPSVVTELVEGDDGLSGVRLRDLETGEPADLNITGLFIAIGHDPASGLFAPWLDTEEGRILTRGGSTATSVEGVFAAGDVVDARYRQAITAAGSGCAAAIDTERWLTSGAGARHSTDLHLATR